eukprot:CAMPEP_0117022890 /NCGR_PEP_ID=MMETSP0472-20121206/17140_1 /TAXON_ID=693140 ORGANISM="Tiarina fusus, Strain LIS" /NCGR_SAMPLE_ID=MMETSP0472 /ASSEMBLY_ACC=CAM_ASM_000603 /LENGTH=424 /DNA_ID=CAMNT_0004728851 /DNA_START=124 /DNA_END=1398 /DNA_ORIENTATION=+
MVQLSFEDVLFPESPIQSDIDSSVSEAEDFCDIIVEPPNPLRLNSSCCEDILVNNDNDEGDFSVSFKSPSQFQQPAPRVSLEDFDILRLVGKGAYGKVHQVRKKDTGQIFAMKVMRKEMLIQTNNVSYTMTERNILRNIRHPFIASLHYAFQTKGKVYLVMEFCNGGQMLFHMRQQAMFSEECVRIYAAEIVLAIEYLHSLDIVHRDIKPENVLLSGDGHLRIADFGLAKVNVTDDHSAKTFCGTIEYMAPEIITGSGHGKAVDWWSLGILICDTLTGNPPFRSKNRNALQKLILKGKFKLPNYLSNQARSLIRSLLKQDPEKRLGGVRGASEVKKHCFFKGIMWEKLYDKLIPPPFVPAIENGLEDTCCFEKKYLKINPGDSSEEEGIPETHVDQFLGFSYVRMSGEYLSTDDSLAAPFTEFA